MQRLFNICRSINAIWPISKYKDKNHTQDAENALGKVQHSLIIKALKKEIMNGRNITNAI